MRPEAEWKPLIFALALFALILLMTYFWPVPIKATDLRNLSPEPLRSAIDHDLANLSPGQQASLVLPPPEIVTEVNLRIGDPVIKRGEVDAAKWAATNTNRSDVFVADLFAGELIMGMAARSPTVGGDWAYAPDPARKCSATSDIMKTDDASRAHALSTGENASYVFVPLNRRQHPGWWIDKSEVNFSKFGDARYFEKVYSNEDAVIYKVLT